MFHERIILDDYHFPEAVDALRVFQVVSTFILLAWMLIFRKIVFSKEVVHPNFTILLIGQLIYHWVALFVRIIKVALITHRIMYPPVLWALNFISDTCLSSTCVIVIAYAAERMFAMCNINTYDAMFRPIPWLGIGNSLLTGLYSMVLILTWHIGVLPTNVVYAAQWIILSVTILIFIFIKIKGDRAYKRCLEERYSTIAQRYATAQNLKAARLVILLAPYKCLSSMFLLAFYILVFERCPDKWLPISTELYYVYLYLQTFDTKMAGLCYVNDKGHLADDTKANMISFQILLILTCHPGFYAQFRLWLQQRFRNKVASCQSGDAPLRSVTGQRMTFSLDEEAHIYFETLQKSWDDKIDQHKERAKSGTKRPEVVQGPPVPPILNSAPLPPIRH